MNLSTISEQMASLLIWNQHRLKYVRIYASLHRFGHTLVELEGGDSTWPIASARTRKKFPEVQKARISVALHFHVGFVGLHESTADSALGGGMRLGGCVAFIRILRLMRACAPISSKVGNKAIG